MRLGTERRYFVEAKRPSVALATKREPAFQIRRYGWNARLPISVLTNFDKLVIYDCRIRPQSADDVRVARVKIYDYKEYVDRFDELYDELSRESVYSGRFDELFGEITERAGTEPFDEYFLGQIETWRAHLAADLAGQNPFLTQDELNFLAQRLLDRIVFLRICEDREPNRYQALLRIKTYEQLKALFLEADRRYDSGLFDFIEDGLSLSVMVSGQVLVGVFRELYYPASPYAFSVVDVGILGEIYERFLGRRVIKSNGEVQITEKDEVVASRGVVPTPKQVVDKIVHRTLAPLCNGRSPKELDRLRIADIACGSGSFLVSAYKYLLNHYLEWYLIDGAEKHKDKVYEGKQNSWYLTLPEKHRILLTHIFGVDIDPQAVDVARFSLMLKVLENVPAEMITATIKQCKIRALPQLDKNIQCGNSLIDSQYFQFDPEALTNEDHYARARPFEWTTAFSHWRAEGGFDAIVGNPPYIRIQNMVHYSHREVDYYQSAVSPYTCARSDNFDKYALFIERGLSLLKPEGRLGYIVPHKFFVVKSGQALRALLSHGKHVEYIVHFGSQQVFGRKSTTYTCILVTSKKPNEQFEIEHIRDLSAWKRGKSGDVRCYRTDEIGSAAWLFTTPAAAAVFARLKNENKTLLGDITDIFVGVQTSADAVYIIKPLSETTDSVTFSDKSGNSWTIEKDLLRPCLKDAILPAFCHPKPNAWIIFPYQIVDSSAILVSSDEMERSYGKTWAYLQANRDILQKRNIQTRTPETWYRYGRSQSLTKFDDTPKLVWPVLSLEPRYAYDDRNIVFTGGGNGPYYGLRPKPGNSLSIYYIQAVLSHPVIEAMVRSSSSEFRGGYQSHGKQFIETLPMRSIDVTIPREKAAHDRIVQLVQALIAAIERAEKTTVPSLRVQVEQQARDLRQAVEKKVSELYGITEAELKIVKEADSLESEQE